MRRSDQDFVDAAVALVSSCGWAGLSPKSLADRLGVHSTAVYRHFSTWDELVVAVFDQGIWQVLEDSQKDLGEAASPRERILSLMRAFRAAAEGDPHIADGFAAILNATNVARTPNADAVTAWLVGQLEQWGVPRSAIPELHQAFETLLIGGILCDFAGHPQHVTLRRQRRRMSGIEAFDEFSRTNEATAWIGTQAFELTARLLLDECDRLAQPVKS